GMSLGPLSITLLMGVLAFQWRQVYRFWTIPILLGLVILYFVQAAPTPQRQKTTEEDHPDPSSKLLTPGFLIFLISSGIRRFGGRLTTGFLTIWLVEAQGWTVAQVGLMLSIGSLLGIFGAPLGGEMAYRLGEKRWAVIALFISYTSFLAAIVTGGFLPFSIFYICRRLFGTMSMAANSSITAMLTPPGQRGTGFAFSFVPGSVAGAVAPMVAAYIADTLGLYPIFLASVAVSFIGLAIFQFGVKIDHR
ncbi:MAG: MFS transporter, partial [Candidatus Bathyarchaeota archaeon]